MRKHADILYQKEIKMRFSLHLHFNRPCKLAHVKVAAIEKYFHKLEIGYHRSAMLLGNPPVMNLIEMVPNL